MDKHYLKNKLTRFSFSHRMSTKNLKLNISKDTLDWFNKLTLNQKLRCIEEQIKFWYGLKKQNLKWKKRSFGK